MIKRVRTLLGNSQRLDGGAMFGNAPKAMWQQWITPDAENRIPLACRCVLVEQETPEGDTRRILLETGVGAFFHPRLRERFGVVEEDHRLLANLQVLGLVPEDIDVVILSHLHFDHAGGLLKPWEADREPELCFPNARFVTGKSHWQRALNPHPRDRASFIPEIMALLENSGRLELVSGERLDWLGDDFGFHFSDGHTPGLMLTEVALPDGPVVFAADLIPGSRWVHLPLTMGYDRYPELLINEKEQLLDHLIARNGRLCFTHDADIAVARVSKDGGGRYQAVDTVECFEWGG